MKPAASVGGSRIDVTNEEDPTHNNVLIRRLGKLNHMRMITNIRETTGNGRGTEDVAASMKALAAVWM